MSKRNKKDLAPRLEEIKDGGDSNQDKESNGVTQEDKEDLLIQLDEYPPLINVEIVEAVCTSIKRGFYPWGTQSEVFKFRVYDPPQCEGLVMPMYVRLGSWWKNGKPRVTLPQIEFKSRDGTALHETVIELPREIEKAISKKVIDQWRGLRDGL